MDIYEIEKVLAVKLNQHRYQHTLGVSFISAALAMRYGYDIHKAQLAGLLHDCAKYMSGDELLDAAHKYALSVNQYEEKNPYLLHGKVGACFAADIYGVSDHDILSSIIYHTTGKPAMSLLEEIVFVADFIEPGRKEIPHLADIRANAYICLHKATLGELQNTIDYLTITNKEIDPATIETRDYYRNLVGKELQ